LTRRSIQSTNLVRRAIAQQRDPIDGFAVLKGISHLYYENYREWQLEEAGIRIK